MTVYLDLDGPIFDTRERYFGVYRTIVGELGGSTELNLSEFWELKRAGLPSAAVLAHDRGAAGIDTHRFTQLWLEQIEAPQWLAMDRVWDGVEQWLVEMARRSTLVLVTLRQNRNGLDQQLAQSGLRRSFQAVLSDSPAAGIGWETNRRLIAAGGFPTDGVLIGDTEVDVRAGKLLALGTIAVSSGIRSREFLATEEPDLLVDALTDVKPEDITAMTRRVATT